MAASEAQKRATAKYIKEKMQQVQFRVKHDEYQQIKEQAARKGLSMRAYILGLIKEDMGTGK